MKTTNNIHNLHMQDMKFISKKWKGFYGRQIAYDTMSPDTYFVINPKTLDLYVYFEPFSTKTNPRILKLCKLSDDYIKDIHEIAVKEVAILKLLTSTDYKTLEKIDTPAKLKAAL